MSDDMTSSATSSPLKDDGKVGIGLGDIDDLPNPVNRARFEHDVPDARISQTVNNLCGLVRARNTSGDAEALDGKTLVAAIVGTGTRTGEDLCRGN